MFTCSFEKEEFSWIFASGERVLLTGTCVQKAALRMQEQEPQHSSICELADVAVLLNSNQLLGWLANPPRTASPWDSSPETQRAHVRLLLPSYLVFTQVTSVKFPVLCSGCAECWGEGGVQKRRPGPQVLKL